MSSITGNPLFIAGAFGLASSALIEVARSVDSSIGGSLSPFLPSQGHNAVAFGASATLLVSGVAKSVFCGRKLLKSEATNETEHTETAPVSKETTETYTTSDLKKRVTVAGRSRAGKSLWIESFFKGLQTCGSPTIFRGTENAVMYERKAGDTQWEITDTPGLFEANEDGQIARGNSVILDQIRAKLDQEVDAVIYAIPQIIVDSDIDSLVAVYRAAPKHAKPFILLTQCEKCDEDLAALKADRFSQLIEHPGMPAELVEVFENCPVILSGAINASDVLADLRGIFNQVQRIYTFNEDARSVLVGALIESEEKAQKCLAQLAEPFQANNKGDLASIAAYFTHLAQRIDSITPKLTAVVKGIDSTVAFLNDYYGIDFSSIILPLQKEAEYINPRIPQLTEKAKELNSIAAKLKLINSDSDLALLFEDFIKKAEELEVILDEINQRQWNFNNISGDLKKRLTDNVETGLPKIVSDFNDIVVDDFSLIDLSILREDFRNNLGYFTIAAKIWMKTFEANQPQQNTTVVNNNNNTESDD